MRIELTSIAIQEPTRNYPLKAQYAGLEVTEAGEWRVHLQDLKIDALALLQDLLASAGVARVVLTTTEGDRTAGLVRVARLQQGNTSSAVLQGLSPLP